MITILKYYYIGMFSSQIVYENCNRLYLHINYFLLDTT